MAVALQYFVSCAGLPGLLHAMCLFSFRMHGQYCRYMVVCINAFGNFAVRYAIVCVMYSAFCDVVPFAVRFQFYVDVHPQCSQIVVVSVYVPNCRVFSVLAFPYFMRLHTWFLHCCFMRACALVKRNLHKRKLGVTLRSSCRLHALRTTCVQFTLLDIMQKSSLAGPFLDTFVIPLKITVICSFLSSTI